MIRTPPRPLARILEARQKVKNPDAIERENKAHSSRGRMLDASRQAGRRALLLVSDVFFFCAFDRRWTSRYGRHGHTDPDRAARGGPRFR